MKTTPSSRIRSLTAAGNWGQDTLHSLLHQQATTQPHCLAVKDQPNREELTGDAPRSLNWSQLARVSDQLAIQLQASGIVDGDRLIVQLPNICELLVCYYAISKLGAVISPIPVQYGSHELQLISDTLDARALLTLPRFREQALGENARAALPGVKVLELGADLLLDINDDTESAAEAAYKFRPAHQDPNRILSICWTSGTTGTPKGVPRSHNMWLATARTTMAAGAYRDTDVLLNPFPLVNMAGLGGFLFPAALSGCAVVLHHPLDPTVFLQQMQNESISFTIAPPALLNQLAASEALWKQFDFSALRRIGSGSAPLSPDMIETFSQNYGKEVVNFYGSNEGISLFATPESAPNPGMRASMFQAPAIGADIQTRLADPQTGESVVDPGQPGELLISGATVFDGYYNTDNSDVFSADGYFRTGDLVEICGDNNDCYRIVGRCKDIINRGGMKISPQELDLALEGHAALLEAAVCSYPDERLGEKICACLVTQPDHEELDLATLQDYLQALGFAKFKLPERIEVFDQLPRNALGKVQRFVLAETVNNKDSVT